jgi:hypothetical protein
MEMFGGVLVPGLVAAADMAAYEADAQVHPAVASLQAFLATRGIAYAFGQAMKVFAVIAHTSSKSGNMQAYFIPIRRTLVGIS